MKIKKDDQVVVIAGKDKGKKGRVLRVFPKAKQVLVEKVNYQTIYLRKSQENPKGGISQAEGRISLSNVMLLDPKSNKPTRVGYSLLKDGSKQRLAKKSEELL